MIPHSTDLVASASSQLLSELFCPPIQIWVLNDTTVFKITAVATTTICPVTILLNILVILALKNRRALQKKPSNILLTSMALADVLLGAVSMPLTITSDVLVLAKVLNVSVFLWNSFRERHDIVYRQLFVCVSSHCYCLGEVRGDRKVGKFQGYRYQRPC